MGRGTAAWVSGSDKPFSTSIQSGKVQLARGSGRGSCLAFRLVYTQGSSWNRGRHAPGGMLSAVPWSVAPLGASLCSDLPAGEGRDSPSLAAATQRGCGHPLLPAGILRPLHHCSLQILPQALRQPSSPMHISTCHLFPTVTVPLPTPGAQ